MFAVVDIAGSQEKVTKGTTLRVPCLPGQEGATVTFDRVLLFSHDGAAVTVGSPYVKGAVVEAKILGNGRGKKITVFTMKHRKRCRKTQGHRQGYTEIEITKVSG
jgi:large subunit ribosomal protein L21